MTAICDQLQMMSPVGQLVCGRRRQSGPRPEACPVDNGPSLVYQMLSSFSGSCTKAQPCMHWFHTGINGACIRSEGMAAHRLVAVFGRLQCKVVRPQPSEPVLQAEEACPQPSASAWARCTAFQSLALEWMLGCR